MSATKERLKSTSVRTREALSMASAIYSVAVTNNNDNNSGLIQFSGH